MMNDQHMKSEKRSVMRVLSVLMIVLMLAISVFALTVTVSADAQSVLTIEKEDLNISGLTLENGRYTKTYDGSTAVTVSLAQNAVIDGLVAGEDVTLNFNAYLSSANAGDCQLVVETTLTGADAYKYADVATLKLPATVKPVELSWKANSEPVKIAITYDPNATSYKLSPAQVQALLPAIEADASVLSTLNATVGNVGEINGAVTVGNKYNTTATVDLGNQNYVIDDVDIEVTVNPIVIDSLVWGGATKWTYGKDMPITLDAYSGNKTYNVVEFVCDDAKFAAGDAGSYTLVARLTDSNFVFADSIDSTKKTLTVTIEPQKYVVSLENVSVIGDEKTNYNVTVKGDIPADVLALFSYTVNGAAFSGTNQYGVYNISVALPATDNYVFYNTNDQRITEPMTATLTVKRQQKLVPVYNEAGEQVGNVILVNKNGFLDNVTATVTALQGYPNITKNNRNGQVYRVEITGADKDQTFTLIIPILDRLLAERTDALTLQDLCIYESANASLTPVSEAGLSYQVTLGNGYYQLDGYTATGAPITFVISPDYNTPFFTTVPGILVIILIVLIILIAMFYIGLLLRRKMDEEATVVVVTDAVEEETEEETVEEATADEQLEALAESVEAEEEVVEEALVEEAVEEAMDDLSEAVAEELDGMPESDDSVETMAVVEDEDEEEDDDLFGFAAADPSTFIDVKEQPDEYAAMLAREALGEIRIVHRYKKSFTAKLAQSFGNVQDYYNEIKNALLSYKGVKGRVSWNYEAFNKGRAHVAKIDAKSKSLYLYLALNPEDLVDTKYNFVDVSSKKKYATTPVLMKIKGDRKFKHALELVEKACGEQLALTRLELEATDYKVERMTIDELVDAGYIKHLAGYILLVDEPEVVEEENVVAEDEAVAVDAVVEEAVAEETTEE